jgi:hypothetical protein
MNTIERQQLLIDEINARDAPEGKSSLELLQVIYKDRTLPLNVRVRCAIEALPFENPKLSAHAVSHMDGKDFASALERAIERSKKPTPPPNSLDRPLITDHGRPFARLDRRF